MPIPYDVQLEIDNYRQTHPQYKNVSDDAIFNIVKRKNPTLTWDRSDRPSSKKRKNTSPSYMNAFSSWFDYGINENSYDWMKSAYNNSLTGMTEELVRGEQRYNLEDYDPNILADIGSMALSFLMPLDVLTFGAGGKFVGQPLAKMATAGMKSRAGSQFGKRALDVMIPMAINQAGTLATYEGAMAGVQAGISGENVMSSIAKGVMHGGIMGGAAGLAGGGLAFKNAEVLKALTNKGKIAKIGKEATAKLDVYDRTKMLATGLPGQIAAEAGVFTTGETLETAIDPERDVRLEDIIVSLGKNIGLFGILKGKSKLLQRGKDHVKLLEEHEILKNATDGLNKNKTKESKVYHDTYDKGVEEVAELRKDGDHIAADKYQKELDKIKAKASNIDKGHFENRDTYKKLRSWLDDMSAGELPASVENYTKIFTGLHALIEAETRLGKTGAYKALTSQMKRTKKEVDQILTKANEDAVKFIEDQRKVEKTPEEQLLDLRNEAIDKKLKTVIDIKTGEAKPFMEGTVQELASALAPKREKIKQKLELVKAEAGVGAGTEMMPQPKLEMTQGKYSKLKSEGDRILNKAEIDIPSKDLTPAEARARKQLNTPENKKNLKDASEESQTALSGFAKQEMSGAKKKVTATPYVNAASKLTKLLKDRNKSIEDISIEDVVDYFRNNRTVETINHNESTGLSLYFQYLKDYNFIEVARANEILRTQKANKAEINELTKKGKKAAKEGVRGAVLQIGEKSKNEGLRLTSYLGADYYIRSQEIGRLKSEHIKKDGKDYYLDINKDVKKAKTFERIVYLEPQFAKELISYLDSGKRLSTAKLTSLMKKNNLSVNKEPFYDLRRRGSALANQRLSDPLYRHYMYLQGHGKEAIEQIYNVESISESIKTQKQIRKQLKIGSKPSTLLKVPKTSKKQVESIAAEIQTSAKELSEQVKHFKKKFPQLTIMLKKTLGKYRGEYVLGRITGHAVEIAKGRAGADTIPHEVAHHVVDILREFGDTRSKEIIKNGERMFGGEEKLVQAIGEYGAGRLRNRSMVSKAKAWVQEFWSNMRTKLGWYTETDVVRVLGKKLMTGKIPTGEIAEFKAKYQTKGEAIEEKKRLNRIISSKISTRDIPTPILREAKEAIFGTENLSKYTEWANVHQMREFNEFVQNPNNWHVNKVEQLNAQYAINPAVSKQHLRDMGVKGGVPENATLHTIKEYQSFIKKNYTEHVAKENAMDWVINLKDSKYTAAKVLGRAITPVWLVLKNHGGKPGRKIAERLLNHEWAEHVIWKGKGDEGIHLIQTVLGKDKKHVHLFDIERTEARLKRKKGDEDYTKEGEMSAEELRFYKNMKKKGTPEYEAYNIWTNKEKTGIADFYWDQLFKELSEHHNPSEIARLKRELDSKMVEGYMTRMWTKRALETIKEDSPWMDKMVTRNLKDAARREAQIWGRNKSKEEISNKRRELEKSEEFKDSIREELYDAMRFGYATVKNPHLIERGALMPEYIKVTNEKGRLETVKVYEDAMQNTAEAYVSRMSKFLSTVRYFPEWTGLGSRYKLGESKRLQVEALETDDTVGAYAALAIKRQLGVDRTHLESLNRPMYKGLAWITNASAAVGLSSPLSGIKNLLIGQPRTAGHFGFRNTMRAWARGFDSLTMAEARTKGQLEYGSKTLELERVRLGEGGAWKNVKMSTLFKFNLMTQTENINRIVSSHAGQLYFGEVLSKLRGQKGMFKMETNKGRLRRVMSEVWHLTPEQINLLETSKDFSSQEVSAKYAEIMHKVGHFSHVSTQGGTSTILLPLWMSSREGRPLTLFQRMAMSTTIDSYRNFVKPVLDYGNFAPLIRATMGHALSGGALFIMYKTLLGKEPPTGSELEQDDGFDKVLMNLWRSEFLGVLGEVLSPYDRDQVAPIAEPIVVRNLTEAKENLMNLLSGGKTFKQASTDYIKNTVVVVGQLGELVQRGKDKSGYYGKFKSTRSWTNKWKMEKGMSKYSPDGLITRRQSSYRDLRDSILFGSEKDIALSYWSAFNTVVTDLEVKNPRSSKVWREKQAKTAIKAMITHFNPLNIADTMQGTPHTMRKEFLNWLTPENKKLALDVERDYHYKIRKYNRYINNPKWRNRYYTYS